MFGLICLFIDAAVLANGKIHTEIFKSKDKSNAIKNGKRTYCDDFGRSYLIENGRRVIVTGDEIRDIKNGTVYYDLKKEREINEAKKIKNLDEGVIKISCDYAKNKGLRWTRRFTLFSDKERKNRFIRIEDNLMCISKRIAHDKLCFHLYPNGLFDKYGFFVELLGDVYINSKFDKKIAYDEYVKHIDNNIKILNRYDMYEYVYEHNIPLIPLDFDEFYIKLGEANNEWTNSNRP